ncbi:putative ribonuclease VapC24 domain protein [Mycobacterium xenopi 3993]|nr:putative ribonuclease VapC24 domain protein [Mycobacterium xenopi 3993]
MLSIDTNVLLYAQNQDAPNTMPPSPSSPGAPVAPTSQSASSCLWTLSIAAEPYGGAHPLDGPEAAEVCQTFRRNRRWALIENAPVMNDVWVLAARRHCSPRLFDARLALTLRHHGVDELATRNINDFTDFGFSRVWDPITSTTDPAGFSAADHTHVPWSSRCLSCGLAVERCAQWRLAVRAASWASCTRESGPIWCRRG